MAKLFYSVPENQQLDTILTIFRRLIVWTKGKESTPYLSRRDFQQLQQQLGIEQLTEQDIPVGFSRQNDALCQDKHQPDLPVFRVAYRWAKLCILIACIGVWMIGKLFLAMF